MESEDDFASASEGEELESPIKVQPSIPEGEPTASSKSDKSKSGSYQDGSIYIFMPTIQLRPLEPAAKSLELPPANPFHRHPPYRSSPLRKRTLHQ